MAIIDSDQVISSREWEAKHEQFQLAYRREHRRYEIARDVYVRLVTRGDADRLYRELASEALTVADEFLMRLEQKEQTIPPYDSGNLLQ